MAGMRLWTIIAAFLFSACAAWAQPEGRELCVNGGFEEGLKGWRYVFGAYAQEAGEAGERARKAISETRKRTGERALVLDAVGVNHEVDAYSEPMTVRPGFGYRLSSSVRQLEGDAGYKVTIDWRDAGGEHLEYVNDWRGNDKPAEYAEHGGIFVAPANAGQAALILGVHGDVRCVFDDISFQELGQAEPLDARPRRDGDGSVRIEGPDRVAAGEAATWKVTYTAGESGLTTGGGIHIRRDPVTFQPPPFQTAEEDAPSYVTAKCESASVGVRADRNITVSVAWPALPPGKTIEVTFTTPAPTKATPGHAWAVLSDCNRDGKFELVARAGEYDIVPGPAKRAVLITPATAEVGRSFEVTCEVRDEHENVVSEYEGTVEVTSGDEGATLPRFAFRKGERARQEGEATFSGMSSQEFVAAGPGLEGARRAVFVSAAVPDLEPARALRAYKVGDCGVLENEHVRLIMPRTRPVMYGYGFLQANAGDRWGQVATVHTAAARYDHTDGTSGVISVHGSELRAETRNGLAVLRFTAEGPGRERGRWSVSARFTLARDARHITAMVALTPPAGVKIRHFTGPTLYAGEGGFGRSKRSALFAGLEYLSADEVSSDDAGVAWEIRDRSAPHPYKVTVPLMAVAGENATVALMWDPLRKWHGVHSVPLALFRSPNRQGDLAHHSMSLSAPFLHDAFDENRPGATEPYALPEGEALTLAADIVVLGGKSDVTDAMEYYVKTRGLPELPRKPRDYYAELDLCARGHMETGWSEEKKGWISAIGWEHGFSGDIANQLLLCSLLSKDEALAQRMRAQVDAAIEARGGWNGLGLSFRLGRPLPPLEGTRRGAYDAMASQHPEGYWTFAQVYDTSGNKGTLAAPDDVELGTCVNRLHPIFRWALISGDQDALQAGLKGLEYIERFTKPAGSESWEVPLVNPNLRAAALACDCYLMAYRLTGEQRYLERARYWAYSGLSFIYLWSAPDRPIMAGSSISVFGTTFFTHPWFGAAVQWVGLVYAEVLQKLAPYDDSCDWRHVAELITIAAMQQQKTGDAPCKHVGFYPDAYSLVKGDDYYEWCLAPNGIVHNVTRLLGYPHDVTTTVMGEPGAQVHLSSVAQIERAQWNGETGSLAAQVEYAPGETVFLAIYGLSKPEQVLLGGQPLQEAGDLQAAEAGWQTLDREQVTLLKLRGSEGAQELVVRGGAPKPYEAPKAAAEILNGGFEDDLTDWSTDAGARVVTDDAHAGERALMLPAPDPARELQCTSVRVKVEGGRRYRLSAFVKQTEGTGNYKVTISWLDRGGRHLKYDNDWQGNDRPEAYTQHGGVFTAPEQAAFAAIILGAKGATCLFDEVSLLAQE